MRHTYLSTSLAFENGSTKIPTSRSAAASDTINVCVGVRSLGDVKTAAMTSEFPNTTSTSMSSSSAAGTMNDADANSTWGREGEVMAFGNTNAGSASDTSRVTHVRNEAKVKSTWWRKKENQISCGIWRVELQS